MERLFVLAVMMDVGLCDPAEYEAALDEAFLASPEDPLLLDLEIASQDRQATWELIAERLLSDPSLLDDSKVEKLFLERLERVYRSESFELDVFATRAYQAWMHLPESLMRSEGLSELSYADDYLSFEHDQAARECYEDMFERARLARIGREH